MAPSPRRYVFANLSRLVQQHERGTSWADIARSLVAQGITITKDRLRVYVSQARAAANAKNHRTPSASTACVCCSVQSPQFAALVDKIVASIEARLGHSLASLSDVRARTAPAAPTAKSALFTVGLEHLEKIGLTGSKARALLGKWRKKIPDDLLLTILHDVSTGCRRPDDPIALITSKVETAAKEAANRTVAAEAPPPGQVRSFADPASFGAKGTLLGWQHIDPTLPRDPDAVRLQLWRTPQGRVALLEPDPGTPIPPPDVDSGLTIVD
jgi:hypothetical protein